MSAIQVKTNTFEITRLPQKRYRQYDVTWTTRDGKDVYAAKKNQIFWHLMTTVDPASFQPVMIYDGKANAYSPVDLGSGREWTVSLGSRTVVDGSQRGAVTIRITPTVSGIVDPKHVEDLTSNRQITPRSAVATNLLQLIVRQASNMNETNNGRAYFIRDPNTRQNPRSPFELWHGLFQAVKPTIGRMILNVDRATAVIYKEGNLLDRALEYLECRNPRDLTLDDRNAMFKRLEGHFKGVEINIPALGSSKYRRKKIRGLIPAAGDYRFKDDSDRELTVAAYYHEHYQITIQFPRILGVRLTGKNHPRPQVVPLEVCIVPPGQIFKKKLPDSLVGEMVKFAAIKPFERLRKIEEGVRRHQTSMHLAEAGMVIDTNPIMVDGLMLQRPTLRYSNNIEPSDGKWNVTKSQFFQPKPLRFWAFINFCPTQVRPQDVDTKVIRTILDCASRLGMGNSPPIRVIHTDSSDVTGTLNSLMGYIVKGKPDNISEGNFLSQLVLLFLLPEHGGPLKTAIKQWGDISNGILTMCTRESKVVRNLTQSQYWNNVLLKVNARLGGCNAIVQSPVMKKLELEPFVIMGADVGHPGVGVQRPSTTSLVYSHDQHAAQYAAIMDIQNPRIEYIERLFEFVAQAVDNFGSKNSAPPRRVFFFRDGLSEGEFEGVAKKEIQDIKKAFGEVFKKRGMTGKAPLPLLTYIIVGKRHHITLYPGGRDHGDQNGNCKPGTVVQSGITHPVEQDFYLQSHAAIQGTSRSSHYTIIEDEIFNFQGTDQIQQLAYALCHVYAKATRSVSIPAPVYYADLVCSRLNNHINPSASDQLFNDASTTASGSASFDLSLWQSNFARVHPRLDKTMYFL